MEKKRPRFILSRTYKNDIVTEFRKQEKLWIELQSCELHPPLADFSLKALSHRFTLRYFPSQIKLNLKFNPYSV